MKICVRAHDFGKSNAYKLSEQINEVGFDGIQFVINKAIEGQTALPNTMEASFLKNMASVFKDNNIEVSMLGSYFNPVHSDKNKVDLFVKKFKEHLSFSNLFDCKYVGTETGSYNDDNWTYNPINHSEKAFQEVKLVMSDLAEYAKSVNSNIALEGAFGHCMHEPRRLKRMLNEIDNGHVFITIDLYNYLDINNYKLQRMIFDECLVLFPNHIVIFHLKDFIVDTKNNKLVQVGLGQGLFDYEYVLPKIKEKHPNAYLIFEGCKPEDMVSSYNFIKKTLKA